MSKLTIVLDGQTSVVEFVPPYPLHELLNLNHTPLDLPCGGLGKCKKCRVQVAGNLSAITDSELAALSPQDYKNNIRLACFVQALGDCTVTLRHKITESIQTDGLLPALSLTPGRSGEGVAVDIGTTTVAAYRYDLSSGELLGTASDINPQNAYGADVVSRMEKSLEGQGEALKQSISGCIRTLLQKLGAQAPSEMVLTGNTAMLYLLCGYSPACITSSPFIQDHFFGESIPSCLLGLDEQSAIYLPRCISAYVGADITCAALAAGFFRDGEVAGGPPCLLVDIGTNGEMVLRTQNRLYCCSTAAGPAFEGAGIHQGMRAREGAIVEVHYHEDSIMPVVLGGNTAEGICGSGIVDLIAALIEAEVVDETGALQRNGHPFERCMTEWNDQPAFIIPGTQVILTQADIRAVQLAKSAVCAGMLTLLHEAGVAACDIQTLYIAGGFGNSINPISAGRIGLIPSALSEKAVAIGNAAGMGASMILLSDACRSDSSALAQAAQTVDLSTNPVFMDQYIEQMMFE